LPCDPIILATTESGPYAKNKLEKFLNLYQKLSQHPQKKETTPKGAAPPRLETTFDSAKIYTISETCTAFFPSMLYIKEFH